MPPVGMQRHGQPHVSSSTHPQNMGKCQRRTLRYQARWKINFLFAQFQTSACRGLLNNQAAQSPNAHMAFNGPPSYPGGPQGAPAPAHQPMGPQMRPHFMPGQQGFLAGRWTRRRSAGRQLYEQQRALPVAVSAYGQPRSAGGGCGGHGRCGGGGGGQIPSPGALQRPQMMSNPMQNVSAMQNVSL